MDTRKKILLGDKDILSRKLEDFYIDINISRDNKEILPYKYDNTFDLTKFYEQERNTSRNFIMYGTIDSYSYDSNNLKISVYQSPNLNQENFLCAANSEHVVNGSMPFYNIYGKLKGKYIINNIPLTFTGCSIFLKIETQPPIVYAKWVEEQQLIFTTLTLTQKGKKVVEQLNYGLDEIITDCDGNTKEINNDFDFFYNKHWIKKDLFFLNLNTYWIGNINDITCLQNAKGNTGMLHYNSQVEMYEASREPTGKIRQNTGSTAISDVENIISCPLPIPTIWIGNTEDTTCLQGPDGNSGMLHYNTVIEVYEATGRATGRITGNTGSFSVLDVYDKISCPLPNPTKVLNVLVFDSNAAGNIAIVPGGSGSNNNLYLSHDMVKISETANPGYRFINFKYNNEIIPLGSDGRSIMVLMDKNKNISANFERVVYHFTMNFSVTRHGDEEIYDALPCTVPKMITITGGVTSPIETSAGNEIPFYSGSRVSITINTRTVSCSDGTYQCSSMTLNGNNLTSGASFTPSQGDIVELTWHSNKPPTNP